MKKRLIVIAMMSMIVTLAGCGEASEISTIKKDSSSGSVTAAAESSAADNSASESSEDSKADESKADEKKESAESKSDKKDEKKETTESKSDKKDEKKETTESKSDKKKEKSEDKKGVAADVTDIIGKWTEVGGEGRSLTVNSDATFEVSQDGGVAFSGTVTVEVKGGVKKYSFINGDRGAWYVPFELVQGENSSILQTENNPVYDETIQFVPGTGGREKANEPIAKMALILGTWYDQDAEIGRKLTINDDGSYTIVNSDGGTESGYVSYADNNNYDFKTSDGEVYMFYLIGEGANQQLCRASEQALAYASSFGRSPAEVTAVGSIENIVGEWTPDDPSMDTLVIDHDGTYYFNRNGSTEVGGTVGVGVRDGVVKYTFYNDTPLKTWLVPFELRNEGGQEILVTEDNQMYGTISFRR